MPNPSVGVAIGLDGSIDTYWNKPLGIREK